MTKKKLYYVSVFTLVFALTLSIFLVSCENDSQNVEEVAKLEFLDVDVSNLSKLNTKQKVTFEKAKARIDSSIVYSKTLKAYKLKISSGAEIRISERMFDLFKSQMDKSNELLNELKKSKDFYVLQDIKDSKKLHVFKNKEVFKNKNYSVARLQSVDPEAYLPANSSAVTVDWSGVMVHLSHQNLVDISDGASVSTVVSGIIGYFNPLAGTVLGSLTGLSAIAANRLANENPNGIIVIKMWGVNTPTVIIPQ